jgi:uncharacterized protein YigE (DUF2233 family)
MRLAALLCCLAVPCAAQAPIRVDTVGPAGTRVQVVRVDLRHAEVRMLWKNEAGAAFGGTRRVERWAAGRLLAVANAGIFDPDSTPTGLHVERGTVRSPLNLRRAPGNFYLRPNAVFAVMRDGTARIVESPRAAALVPRMGEATQSGPVLVLRGRIHPAFSPPPGGTPLERTAVGVCSPHEVVLARTTTGSAITLYEMARLFRDTLRCPDALFLDGNRTVLHLPGAAPAHREGFVGFIGVFARP